jgi:two-component system, chemotaxis family, protein-glutamate methylesterase/glutaminase
VIRRLLTDVLSAEPGIEVAVTASNGQIALTKLQTAKVDVVVLDIEMPEMDGLQTLRELRKTNRRLPVIMFSTLTEFGARATLDALSAGASDYVTKPANVGSVTESREAVRTQLVPKVLALAGAEPPPAALVGGPRALPPLPHRHEIAPRIARPERPTARPRILVIGSSTGGPEALNKLIPRLPADLHVPVLIVQHMPPLFTTMLAERLNRMSSLTVVESAGSEPLEPGKVYLAPGDFHLEAAAVGSRSKFCSSLTKAAPENFCRPSVDVLFRSAARCYGAAVLGVVLTGMGSDGRAGAQKIVEAGGNVIVQDRDSSVVWGMPGAVAASGLADEVLPLDLIASAIVRRLADGVEPIPARTA